jgi:hypothetical protein
MERHHRLRQGDDVGRDIRGKAPMSESGASRPFHGTRKSDGIDAATPNAWIRTMGTSRQAASRRGRPCCPSRILAKIQPAAHETNGSRTSAAATCRNPRAPSIHHHGIVSGRKISRHPNSSPHSLHRPSSGHDSLQPKVAAERS